jgi:hypothetical protein
MARIATTEEAAAAKATFIAEAQAVSPETRKTLIEKLSRFARPGYGIERMQIAPGLLASAETVQETIDAIAAMDAPVEETLADAEVTATTQPAVAPAGAVVVKIVAKDSKVFGKATSHLRGVLHARFDGATKTWTVPAGYAAFATSPQARGYGIRVVTE